MKHIDSATSGQAAAGPARQGHGVVADVHDDHAIAVILLVAWLLGFVGIYTVGSFIHVLLVVAIVLFPPVSGRRVLG